MLTYCSYVPSPMCHYLSLSRCNPYTVIRSNCRTPWSRRQSSCGPTLVSTLSTYCCSCTCSAGCCLAIRGRGHFLRILCNTCILSDFYSFLCFRNAPYLFGCVPCGMRFILVSGEGVGDYDVDREVGRRLCRFFFRRPCCGAGPLLSVVVAAFALSSSLSDC